MNNDIRNTSPMGSAPSEAVDAALNDEQLEALNGGGIVGAGLGIVGGLWSGAGVGALAGPVGAVVGGLGGAIAGGIAGAMSGD